jgi:hypothetical protein
VLVLLHALQQRSTAAARLKLIQHNPPSCIKLMAQGPYRHTIMMLLPRKLHFGL